MLDEWKQSFFVEYEERDEDEAENGDDIEIYAKCPEDDDYMTVYIEKRPAPAAPNSLVASGTTSQQRPDHFYIVTKQEQPHHTEDFGPDVIDESDDVFQDIYDANLAARRCLLERCATSSGLEVDDIDSGSDDDAFADHEIVEENRKSRELAYSGTARFISDDDHGPHAVTYSVKRLNANYAQAAISKKRDGPKQEIRVIYKRARADAPSSSAASSSSQIIDLSGSSP